MYAPTTTLTPFQCPHRRFSNHNKFWLDFPGLTRATAFAWTAVMAQLQVLYIAFTIACNVICQQKWEALLEETLTGNCINRSYTWNKAGISPMVQVSLSARVEMVINQALTINWRSKAQEVSPSTEAGASSYPDLR